MPGRISIDLLVRGEADGSISIGEIKPVGEERIGANDLTFYEEWFRENRAGTTVRRMTEFPGNTTLDYFEPEAPLCKQKIVIKTTGTPGVFIYECFPKREEVAGLPECQCDKEYKKKKRFSWKAVAVALAIAAAVAAAGKAVKVAQEKILEEFAKRAMLSMSEQMAEQAAKQFAKKAAAVLALIEMAAAFILLFVSDAKAEIGPGDSPLQTLAETMGRNGAPMPDSLRELIENDPDLKAQVERGLQNHDSSDLRDELNGRMVQLLDEHASEFTPDEIRRILALTHAAADATDGMEMTVARLHEIAGMRSVSENSDGSGSGSGSGGNATGDGPLPSTAGGPFPDGDGTGIPENDDQLGDGDDGGGSAWDDPDGRDGAADGRQGGGTGQRNAGGAGQPGTYVPGQPGTGQAGTTDNGNQPGQPGTTDGGGTPGQAGTTDQGDGTPGQTGTPGHTGVPGHDGGTTDQNGDGRDGPRGTTDQGDGSGGTADTGDGGGSGTGGGAGDGSFTTSTGVEKTGKTPASDPKTQASLENTEQQKFGAEIPADTTYLMVPAGTKLASGNALMVIVMGRDASSVLFIGKGKMVAHQNGNGWSVTMPAGIPLYSSGGRYGQTRKTDVPVTNPDVLP